MGPMRLMGFMGSMGSMGLMGLIGLTSLTSPIRPLSPIPASPRILILGPPAAGHQLQNALGALRGAFSGNPLFQLDECFDSSSDHGLFDFIRDRIFFDLLAEVAPHRHSLIAVTMEERATRSGADAECPVQMARNDLPAQSRDLERVKTAERLRRRRDCRQ